LDIAELRFPLISLAFKPAYRRLSPADFDHAYNLAKRLARINNAKDDYEHHHQFGTAFSARPNDQFCGKLRGNLIQRVELDRTRKRSDAFSPLSKLELTLGLVEACPTRLQ
jgi:hypothetical protein